MNSAQISDWLRESCVRGLGIAALVGALVCTPAQGAQGADQQGGESLTRALLSADSVAAIDVTAQQLRELGQAAIEPLARALVLEETPCGAAQRAAAVSVLRERGGEFDRNLVLFAQRGLPASATTRALNLIAEVATERGLSSLVIVAASAWSGCKEDEEADASLASTLRSATTSLLTGRPAALRRLESAMQVCPREFVPSMLQALADTASTEALSALADLLRTRTWDPSFILDEIGRATHALRAPFDEHVCSTVRAELGNTDLGVVREAAVCAGWLEDDLAVPALLERFDDSNAGVRGNVLWALRRITGKAFAAERVVWQRWYDEQNDWWQSRAPQLLVDLGSSAAARRASAINELLRHDFPRHALSRELARALSPSDMFVFRLGCAGLAAMHSHAAEPALREWIGDTDPEVVQLAQGTLERIARNASRAPPASPSGPGLGTAAGRGLPRAVTHK